MAAVHSGYPMECRKIAGTLTGMGVGPGDPQLMTLRAAEVVRNADCVAWMATRPGRSRARETAAAWIAEHARTLEFTLPMDADPRPAERIYDQAATRIADELRLNRDVACLCEGDPMFYGSFMYLHARLHTKYPVRIVPGVSSVAAASASIGVALAARDDRFGVVPASLDDASLRAAASAFETVAFLKVGRHLSRLRHILEDCGVTGQAAFVEDASLASETACPLSRAPARASYFSMVVLRRGKASSL